MKKIYPLLVLLALIKIAHGQLVLTKAFNGPVPGSSAVLIRFDTTVTLAKSTGLNQLWDYSALVTSTFAPITSSYTTVSAVPGASTLFPSANLVGFSVISPTVSSTSHYFYNSTVSDESTVGIKIGTLSTTNYSNPQVTAVYPFTYGSSNTDTYASIAATPSFTTNETGTLTLNGTGTGTVVLPGGHSFANCLQRKTVNNYISSNGFTSTTITVTGYNYFHSSQAAPILSFFYTTTKTGVSTLKSFNLSIAQSAFVGLKEEQLSESWTVAPNPANDYLLISSHSLKTFKLTLTTNLGQLVKEEQIEMSPETKINTAQLPSGVYYLTIDDGVHRDVKKIIVHR
ncbi:MAG: T9SS type A sorting domain-containing protein [Sediminibacterium sp.]|nr:T9SS type A sorting domain-containing protein [Sediminibacterium sp.]